MRLGAAHGAARERDRWRCPTNTYVLPHWITYIIARPLGLTSDTFCSARKLFFAVNEAAFDVNNGTL